MQFGSILVLIGILGVVGVLIAVLLNASGVTSFINVLINAIGHMFNFIGRILSFAPGWLKVGFFAILMVSTLGLMVNWLFAADIVCAGGTPYVAPSLIESWTAKGLPTAGELKSSNYDSASGALKSLTLNPYGTSIAPTKFGTFLTVGGDVDIVSDPPLSTDWATDAVIAVPPTFDQTTENGSIISGTGFLAKEKIAALKLCRATSLFQRPFSDYPMNACYMTSNYDCGLDTQMAVVTYRVVGAKSSTGKVMSKISVQVVSAGLFSGDSWSEDCSQHLSGSIRLIPSDEKGTKDILGDATVQDSLFSGSGSDFAGYDGYFIGKYIRVVDVGIENLSGTTAREEYVAGFPKAVMSGATLTYSCSKDDDVELGVFGMKNLFSVTGLMFLLVIGGLLSLMKGIGYF